MIDWKRFFIGLSRIGDGNLQFPTYLASSTKFRIPNSEFRIKITVWTKNQHHTDH